MPPLTLTLTLSPPQCILVAYHGGVVAHAVARALGMSSAFMAEPSRTMPVPLLVAVPWQPLHVHGAMGLHSSVMACRGTGGSVQSTVHLRITLNPSWDLQGIVISFPKSEIQAGQASVCYGKAYSGLSDCLTIHRQRRSSTLTLGVHGARHIASRWCCRPGGRFHPDA